MDLPCLNGSECIFAITPGWGPSWGGGFVWGRAHVSPRGDRIATAVAVGCDEVAEMLDVKTTFAGPELPIDPAHPPQTDETSAKNSPISDSTALISPCSIPA